MMTLEQTVFDTEMSLIEELRDAPVRQQLAAPPTLPVLVVPFNFNEKDQDDAEQQSQRQREQRPQRQRHGENNTVQDDDYSIASELKRLHTSERKLHAELCQVDQIDNSRRGGDSDDNVCHDEAIALFGQFGIGTQDAEIDKAA